MIDIQKYNQVYAILSLFFPKKVYGTAELKLEKDRFVIAVSQFIIELTKKYGRPNVAKWIKPFPLDGLINLGRPQDLPTECETRRIIWEVKNPKITTEEKLLRVFVEINHIPVAATSE